MEHLPIWASIITALGGIGVLWTIIWTILNFRAKRKKESADGDKAAGEAEHQTIENLEKLLTIIQHRATKCEEELSNAYNSLSETRKLLIETKKEQLELQAQLYEALKSLKSAQEKMCKRENCQDRINK